MNKIVLNESVLEPSTDFLPLLIHGKHGSGASLYTVVLTANFYNQGFSVLFLCGYKMAEEEFIKQIGNNDIPNAQFFTQDKTEEFKKALVSNNNENHLIVIKNIELFDVKIIDLVINKQKVIISGDVNKSKSRQEILAKNITTQIYFSPFEDIELPKLNKYEGFFIRNAAQGITKISSL